MSVNPTPRDIIENREPITRAMREWMDAVGISINDLEALIAAANAVERTVLNDPAYWM